METEWISLKDSDGKEYVASLISLWEIKGMTQDDDGHGILSIKNAETGKEASFLVSETK